MIRDLITVERELGFSYEMRGSDGAGHYQQICPRCRRSLYGLAQGAMWTSAPPAGGGTGDRTEVKS